MSKFAKRTLTNFKREQRREKNYNAVMAIYAEGLREDYPPMVRQASKPTEGPLNKTQERTRRQYQQIHRTVNMMRRQRRALYFNNFTEADRLEKEICRLRPRASLVTPDPTTSAAAPVSN